MTGQRLRHLLVAAFVADRPTLPPRNAYAMVERVLRTPAGKQLEYELGSSAVRRVDVRSPAVSEAEPARTNGAASRR